MITPLALKNSNHCHCMSKQLFILGITNAGKPFRPSDWSERLCGVMRCFGPDSASPQAHLGYSRYVRPIMIGDTKCVVLDEALRETEPLAYDFVISFAKDNDLQVSEACALPDSK